MEQEIQGLLQRGALVYVHEVYIPKEGNVIDGRFVMAIKQPETEKEKYKARFVVLGHKYRENLFIIHTSRTVRYRNIRRLLTQVGSLGLEVWNQDVI